MTLLTAIQRQILTFALIIIFAILIYVLFRLIKRESKHAKKTKFLSLDSVISYKKMKKIIQYTISQEKNNSFSLLMVTIDNFEQILDYVNAKSTSDYLKRVGRLLEISLPLGGKLCQTDERETFIIFIPEIYEKNTLLNVATKFKNMAERPVELNDGSKIEKSSSVAIIEYPSQATKLNELIGALKTTIYAIKKLGGNQIKNYSIDMLEERANFKTYEAIKKAIKNKDIKINYIPFYSTKTKYTVGSEVDCIWNKDEKINHFIDFMPNLETSNDSYWFGLWVLEKALSSHVQILGINNNQKYDLMLQVGVRQFENELIAMDLIHLIDKYSLSADNLILKIINPLQVNKETQFIKSLIELQSYGVRLALDINKIDDNMYYLLNEYKIDVLLIDQSLLSLNHDKQLEVEELLNFSKANQLEVIATGVADVESIKNLDAEITKVTGPVLSGPLDKDQILNQLNKRLDIE